MNWNFASKGDIAIKDGECSFTFFFRGEGNFPVLISSCQGDISRPLKMTIETKRCLPLRNQLVTYFLIICLLARITLIKIISNNDNEMVLNLVLWQSAGIMSKKLVIFKCLLSLDPKWWLPENTVCFWFCFLGDLRVCCFKDGRI